MCWNCLKVRNSFRNILSLQFYFFLKANIAKAVEFIQVTYKKSLELDLKAAIDSISVLTLRLRKERIKHFKGIVGSKLYVRSN